MENINKEKLTNYILQTQAQIDHYPDYPLRQELDTLADRLLNGGDWLEVLRQAAAKERTMIEKGMIEDEDGDGTGFFGALLAMAEMGLDGLGRFSWKSLRERARHITEKINRVNPVTVAARNALRVLLSMNIFGYASAIMKSSEVKRKVLDLYKRLGGKEANMLHALETGSRKRPLMAHKGKVDGTDGLGSLNIQTLLKQAGGFLSQIKKWIEEVRAEERRRADERRRERDARRRAEEARRRAEALKRKLSAIRALLSMNIFGYTKIIASHSGLYKKVVDYYVHLGGKRDDIVKAIQAGARRRGLLHFNHNTRVHGLGELGEPVTIASLLSAAGAFLLQIKKWIAEAGVKVTGGGHSHTSPKPANTPQPPSPSYSQLPKHTLPKPAATMQPGGSVPQAKSGARVNIGGSSKTTKLFIGLGIAGLTGIALYAYDRRKHKKGGKLSGITLK